MHFKSTFIWRARAQEPILKKKFSLKNQFFSLRQIFDYRISSRIILASQSPACYKFNVEHFHIFFIIINQSQDVGLPKVCKIPLGSALFLLSKSKQLSCLSELLCLIKVSKLMKNIFLGSLKSPVYFWGAKHKQWALAKFSSTWG